MAELPHLQEELRPDFTIVQAENLAHGKGITPKTIDELRPLHIHCFTGGNHTFSKPSGIPLLEETDIIRPANYPETTPGVGLRIFHVGDIPIIVLNLQGVVGMKEMVECPFKTADRLLNDPSYQHIPIRLIDFHGEATSERVAMGWHLDGRASLLWGTHTHVQTNDARILPKGLGYVTDVGMVGERDGVIGVQRENIVHNFLHPDDRRAHEFAESGEASISGMFADINETTGVCTHIEPFTIFSTII